MEPLAIPMATIMRPTILPKLTTQEVRARKNVQLEFHLPDRIYTLINKAGNYGSNKQLKIQVRCLRLNAVGFEHAWPKFGAIRLGSGALIDWKIPPPPND